MNFDVFQWINKGEIQIEENRIVMQAPTGNGGERVYKNLSIEHKTVKNIRAGV